MGLGWIRLGLLCVVMFLLDSDWVGNGRLLTLIHEAGGQEVLHIVESAVFVGEMSCEPGDVSVLVEDHSPAQHTPHSHLQHLSVVILHYGMWTVWNVRGE